MSTETTADPKTRSIELLRMLTSRRPTDRYKAIDALNQPLDNIDVPLLRNSVLEAVSNEFRVRKRVEDGDNTTVTRSWLLSALGRLAAGDEVAEKECIRHVDSQQEPDLGCRYWALEGLIAAKSGKTLEACELVLARQDDPLVAMLARAYLALGGNEDAQETIDRGLIDKELLWPVLRALRVVPLQSAVDKLCEIVQTGSYTDATYDATVALGRLPSKSSRASDAAQALSLAITKMRGSPWKDGMRAAAITALGNLAVESSGPLLLEELTDDNPEIVRQASRSVEKILGIRSAVTRIVEAAAKNNRPAMLDAWSRALRWLDRSAVADELENLMGSGAVEQQEVARTLLSEIGGLAAFEKLRARTIALKQFVDILDQAEARISELFEQSIHEAQKGFGYATIMDLLVFGFGMLLLLSSAAMALLKAGSLEAWLGVGGAGVAGVIYGIFISNPREKVREAVDHLMVVKIIFLAYLRRLHQTDQSFTRLLLENDKITPEQLKGYSDIVGSIMSDTVSQLALARSAVSKK